MKSNGRFLDNRRTALALAAILVASLVAVGGAVSAQSSEADPQHTSYLRVVHASPDAPPVDVYVDNETVLTDVPFGAVSDYLTLEAGTYNVSVTAAGDPDTVVFEGEVTLNPRTVTTLAASGEISEDAETEFSPAFFPDDALTPDENESAVSIVHLSPDAPAVDVTAANGSVVLADNVTYGNATSYVTVPAGDYSVEIREETEENDGHVVTSVNVSLAGGTAYSALAVGYLNPDDAPAETPFEVVLTEDATSTLEFPSDDEGTATETETETETEMATETEAETATETETEAGTETEVSTEY